MANFIPVAIAHDSVCERGCEWLFNAFGLFKQKDAFRKDDRPASMSKEMKAALDKDMEEFQKSLKKKGEPK